MRNKKRFDTLAPISNILRKVCSKRFQSNFHYEFILSQISRNWDQIVGSRIAPYTAPRNIRSNTLFINTINSVWANELNFMKESILENINSFLHGKKIKQIHFSIGEIARSTQTYLSTQEIDKTHLSEKEKTWIEETTSPLDGELKNIISRLIVRSIKHRKCQDEFINKK